MAIDLSQKFNIDVGGLDYLYPVENSSVTFDFTDFEGALNHVKRINLEKFGEYFKSELDRIESGAGPL